MSRILVTASPKIKPTRKSPRPSTRFGAGILRYVPSEGRQPYTAADLAWVAQNPVTAEDRHYDAMAFQAMAVRRLENGHCF